MMRRFIALNHVTSIARYNNNRDINESAISRLINIAKSIRFIGDKPLLFAILKGCCNKSGVRVVRISYWWLKVALQDRTAHLL